MEANYTYTKSRREFGKQCRFSDHGPIVLVNITPDPSLDEQWIQKNPVNKSTNKGVQWSEHEVTINIKIYAHTFFFYVNKIYALHFVCLHVVCYVGEYDARGFC